MLLNELFKSAKEIEISSVSCDSRLKNENGIFFCLNGYRHNGHDFVDEAILNGAKVIVHSEEIEYDAKCIYVRVEDVYKVYNECLKLFYHNPSQKIKLIGVTGSLGKTSCSYLLKQILDKYTKAGYMGNLGFIYDDIHQNKIEVSANSLNESLNLMLDKDVEYAVIECDAEDLSNKVFDSLDFSVAIYTNIIKEKMELYASLEEYIESKKNLFANLRMNDLAIINIDDEYANEVMESCIAKIITYGESDEADYQITNIEYSNDKTNFILKCHDHSYSISTNLLGDFSVYNLVASLATVRSLGYDLNDILNELDHLYQASGRMSSVEAGQNFKILIDITKEFETLNSVLSYASKITDKDKKIVACIGLEGGKDLEKHKKLANLLNEYCDLVVLTEDDPKNEDTYTICQNIGKHLKCEYIIVTSRKEAIEASIELMNSKDTLLILGKGDENFIYRSFGKEPYMGDSAVVRKYIKDRREN